MSGDSISFTKAELQSLLEAAVRAANAPNALEQKAIAEDLQREHRRALFAVELGKVEEGRMLAKKNGCTHSRLSMAAGKNGGNTAPRGEGEWTTGGQLSGNAEEAMLICTRCSYMWKWKVTNQEREFINNTGLLGMAPPPHERVTWEG
jgi:hypothetical protein